MIITQQKFIVICDKNKIFCHGGFKDIDTIKDSEVRLFAKASNALTILESIYPKYDKNKIKVKKVIVNILTIRGDLKNV